MNHLPDDILDHLQEVTGASGRYTIEEEIGRGGMGIVYAAYDHDLDRRVALKTGKKAQEEARMVAQLEHPGIVPIHDSGQLPDGRPFYVMKLVEGRCLDARAAALSDRLRVFQKICDTVAFAHSRGVIHLDLKPANVMVGAFGAVFVMDWGVARRVDCPQSAGTVAGTPEYMAPEQAGGRSNERSDIYSLGVILRFLLPQKASPALFAVAAKASAHDPGARYGRVEDLAADIARYLDKLAVSAYKESIPERFARFCTRNQTLLLLLAAYLLVRFFLFFLRRI